MFFHRFRAARQSEGDGCGRRRSAPVIPTPPLDTFSSNAQTEGRSGKSCVRIRDLTPSARQTLDSTVRSGVAAAVCDTVNPSSPPSVGIRNSIERRHDKILLRRSPRKLRFAAEGGERKKRLLPQQQQRRGAEAAADPIEAASPGCRIEEGKGDASVQAAAGRDLVASLRRRLSNPEGNSKPTVASARSCMGLFQFDAAVPTRAQGGDCAPCVGGETAMLRSVQRERSKRLSGARTKSANETRGDNAASIESVFQSAKRNSLDRDNDVELVTKRMHLPKCGIARRFSDIQKAHRHDLALEMHELTRAVLSCYTPIERQKMQRMLLRDLPETIVMRLRRGGMSSLLLSPDERFSTPAMGGALTPTPTFHAHPETTAGRNWDIEGAAAPRLSQQAAAATPSQQYPRLVVGLRVVVILSVSQIPPGRSVVAAACEEGEENHKRIVFVVPEEWKSTIATKAQKFAIVSPKVLPLAADEVYWIVTGPAMFCVTCDGPVV